MYREMYRERKQGDVKEKGVGEGEEEAEEGWGGGGGGGGRQRNVTTPINFFLLIFAVWRFRNKRCFSACSLQQYADTFLGWPHFWKYSVQDLERYCLLYNISFGVLSTHVSS
jgi:hypothetical protein